MIFIESTIKISNNVSKMDSTIVLYRGDKNIEIRFTILQSPFKYSNTVATNVIESTNASFGQLVIKTPNDKPPIFSDVSATKEGTVLFTITKEMIDEIEEVGVYTFQIRLLDENKQSRGTIPPVENGIEIKEPIAIEDDNSTNVVGLAKANYAVATLSDVDTPTFDDNGKYNKTNWNDGDIITNESLNKIEDGIYTTNENVTATKKYVDDNAVILPLPIHTIQETTAIVIKIVNIMDLVDGVIYSTHRDPNETRRQSYRVAYVCDDGSFKIICTLALANKIAHLLKVIHFAKNNYSTLSDNNTVYTVNYTKHSTNTDVEVTKTLQYYLPIANTTEYNPTKEYHPATKKYVDDRFVCTDLIENVGTIPKEEMQKCNNGTSRYVSSIKFKEFFADYKYCVYQGTYGDKNILMKYDAEYNRMLAYDLDIADTYDIMLGFDFDTNYMYPFNGGAAQVKSYQFTNDLVIVKNDVLNPSEVLTKNNTHEYTPTNDYNPATKKYVDDIKTDIDSIKTDLGTAQLTTSAKDVKGAVNEVAAQYKDIANNYGWNPTIKKGTIVLHFDDLYKSFYDNVFPILKNNNVKFSVPFCSLEIESTSDRTDFCTLTQSEEVLNNPYCEPLFHGNNHTTFDTKMTEFTFKEIIDTEIKYFKSKGYNVLGWVAPNTQFDENKEKIISQYFNFGFSLSNQNHDYNNFYKPVDFNKSQHFMNRITLDTFHTINDPVIVNALNSAKNGGLVCFYGHRFDETVNGTVYCPSTFIQELITWAIDNNVDILTSSEAFIKHNINNVTLKYPTGINPFLEDMVAQINLSANVETKIGVSGGSARTLCDIEFLSAVATIKYSGRYFTNIRFNLSNIKGDGVTREDYVQINLYKNNVKYIYKKVSVKIKDQDYETVDFCNILQLKKGDTIQFKIQTYEQEYTINWANSTYQIIKI